MKNRDLFFTIFFLTSFFFIFISCKKKNSPFAIITFNPISNWQPEKKIKTIELDYTEAIDSGFIIPTTRQIDSGEFLFEFELLNKTGNAQSFFYKIFYQNESYKYPEYFSKEKMNPLAEENFYGSWEETDLGFIETPEIPSNSQPVKIRSQFRIVGNPRDEAKYYGSEKMERPLTSFQIMKMENYIKTVEPWMKDIQRKAEERKISIEEQIRDDAIYGLNERRKNMRINNRWKRNPRVGNYSFLLVVVSKEYINEIPAYLRDISIPINNTFINPYWYFLYGPGSRSNNIQVALSEPLLHIKGKPNLGSGLFISEPYLAANGVTFKRDYYHQRCNYDSANYVNAHFGQYFHYIMGEMKFKNIPVVKDLNSSDFTRQDYQKYLKTYNESNMVESGIGNSDCPCKDVQSDSAKRILTFSNPSVESDNWSKTNVGVISRTGFTYGKFTAKIKFTELLNEHQMWNGITNAFWMLNESNDEWNRVRECKLKGFIPKSQSGEFAERVSQTSYSEIDIEIRKASPIWPLTSYNFPHRRPAYDGTDYDDIIVTCTNWDLACAQPKRFTSGTQYSKFNGQSFQLHRWNPWYQALTTKYSVKDDDLNKRDYYYYQIEWKPDTLIWRIGPEKSQLHTICFMDAKITTVPNNQMLMVITQEYHPSVWWPESPQLLEFIPFPKSSIEGNVLEIEIE